MEHAKKLLRTFLGLPVTLISFIFIGKIFFDNRHAIVHSFTTLNIPLFLIGLIFFSLFFAIKSFVWLEIMSKRGFILPARSTIFYYSLSEIKRFVPGSILAFIGRMDALSANIPRKETLKGIGIEALLLALSALIFSIPAIAYPLFKAREDSNLPSLVPGMIVLILFLIFTIFIISRFRKTIMSYIDSLLLFLLAWLFYAAGCFFIAISFSYIYPNNMPFVLSFFVLSWLAGYLSFVTPMGLGVRELAITGSLSMFVPLPVASAIAILTRVGMTLGELLYLGISYVVYKLKTNSKLLKINPYLAIVLFASLLYFVFFANYTFQRHNSFISGRFDLGNMSQTVWNTSQGHFFVLTNPDGTEKISRLADHSDILLVIFAPLYYLWSDPRTLLLVQSFSLACGGIVTYFLAKEIIRKEKLALILSLSFLCNFWIHEQNMFDFHAVSIGTTLLLATFYFLLKKRYILFGIFLILSVMTKENVFLVASIFGLYLIIKEKKWISGTLLTIIPTVIFFYLTTKVIPHARGNIHFALTYYSYIGDSTQSILRNLLFKPQLAFSHLISFSSLNYLQELLLPTGFLSLMSPVYLIFALPDLAINLLSNNQNLRSYQFHYGAIIVPFIYISTMYGIVFILKKVNNPYVEKGLFYYILATLLFSTYFYSPIPGMKDGDFTPYDVVNGKVISSYLSQIPDNASVSASNNVGAHLSHRENIYVIPNAINSADYVVLYGEKVTTFDLVNKQKYQLVVQDDKNLFYLFKKKTSS